MVHLGILLQQEEEKNREEIQMKPQLEVGEDNCSETFWIDRDDDYIIIRVHMWRWSTKKNSRYVINKMKSTDLPKVGFSKHLSLMGFLWSLLFKCYAIHCSWLTILQCTQVFPFSEEESIKKTEIIRFVLVRQFTWGECVGRLRFACYLHILHWQCNFACQFIGF